MPLLLGQLVYTSFPEVGFKVFASAQVPLEIQQAFVQQVVYQHWDAYNPPVSVYRAAYLHQITLEHSLFGWMYNDGLDDLGRSHVPYFVCYYLAGALHPVQLENIFTCLYRGPVTLIDRQSFPAALESLVAPDLWNYQPAHLGVAIPPDVREQSHLALKERKLLEIFVSADERERVAHRGLEKSSYLDSISPRRNFWLFVGAGIATILTLAAAIYRFPLSMSPSPQILPSTPLPTSTPATQRISPPPALPPIPRSTPLRRSWSEPPPTPTPKQISPSGPPATSAPELPQKSPSASRSAPTLELPQKFPSASRSAPTPELPKKPRSTPAPKLPQKSSPTPAPTPIPEQESPLAPPATSAPEPQQIPSLAPPPTSWSEPPPTSAPDANL